MVASLACTRPNPAFDDTGPGDMSSTVVISASAGSGPSNDDGTTTQTGPAGDTAGDDDALDTGAAETGTTNTGTDSLDATGEPSGHRIIVFRGPELPGHAVGELGGVTFNFAANQCREHYNAVHRDLLCPGGQVWGLLGSDNNHLEDYPSFPSGHFLEGAAVFATDETTHIANNYADLIAGNLVVPMASNAIEGVQLEILWWGESSAGAPPPNCENWTVDDAGVLGAAIIVDDTNPLFVYENMPCDLALPILCICF
ncbi:MAG: hypothetical protein AAGF11_46755 [Myxococcota bacterium]